MESAMEREGSEYKPAVWSSEQWVAYFQTNAKELLPVPWEAGVGATPEELARIVDSLGAWQLGETSDGRHLLAAAANYAAKLNDPPFVDAIRLFIAEEQRHGEHLGRFLDLAGVPRKSWDWGDAVFRAFRYLMPRMEVWATVVVMVETHAMLYYAALRRATASALLRRICQQILRDEVPHIRFQCERLAILHRSRPPMLRAITMCVHRVLFAGITCAVWVGHRRALRAGGFTFGRFWRMAWAKMGAAWSKMDSRTYRWPATVKTRASRGARSILEFGE
jgi:hypothetical protein